VIRPQIYKFKNHLISADEKITHSPLFAPPFGGLPQD
jgi:hypothetical protein